MKSLKRAGNFRELRHGDPDGPSLIALRGGLREANRAAIVQYLRSASIIWMSGSRFDDALDPSRQQIGDLAAATDGEWEWPTDLAYYVETYSVALPEEFLAHMRTNNWRPPPLTDDELWRLVHA